MNIVGPRPERPTIFAELREHIAEYPLRQRAKPGITGLAQINHHYDRSLEDVRTKVRYDLEYIRRRSLLGRPAHHAQDHPGDSVQARWMVGRDRGSRLKAKEPRSHDLGSFDFTSGDRAAFLPACPTDYRPASWLRLHAFPGRLESFARTSRKAAWFSGLPMKLAS